MPRLVGKQSKNSVFLPAFLLIAVGTAGCLEYFGFINLIPHFGREQSVLTEPYAPSTESNN
jgi:hypothetical protein